MLFLMGHLYCLSCVCEMDLTAHTCSVQECVSGSAGCITGVVPAAAACCLQCYLFSYRRLSNISSAY